MNSSEQYCFEFGPYSGERKKTKAFPSQDSFTHFSALTQQYSAFINDLELSSVWTVLPVYTAVMASWLSEHWSVNALKLKEKIFQEPASQPLVRRTNHYLDHSELFFENELPVSASAHPLAYFSYPPQGSAFSSISIGPTEVQDLARRFFKQAHLNPDLADDFVALHEVAHALNFKSEEARHGSTNHLGYFPIMALQDRLGLPNQAPDASMNGADVEPVLVIAINAWQETYADCLATLLLCQSAPTQHALILSVILQTRQTLLNDEHPSQYESSHIIGHDTCRGLHYLQTLADSDTLFSAPLTADRMDQLARRCADYNSRSLFAALLDTPAGRRWAGLPNRDTPSLGGYWCMREGSDPEFIPSGRPWDLGIGSFIAPSLAAQLIESHPPPPPLTPMALSAFDNLIQASEIDRFNAYQEQLMIESAQLPLFPSKHAIP